jgi:hypothetical protein
MNAKTKHNSRNHHGSIVKSEGAGNRLKFLTLLKNQTMSSPIDETDDSDSDFFFKDMNNSEGLTELLHKNESSNEKLKNMSSKLLALKGNVFSESEGNNEVADSSNKMAENFFEFALKHMSHLSEDQTKEYIREEPRKKKDHSKVDDICSAFTKKSSHRSNLIHLFER